MTQNLRAWWDVRHPAIQMEELEGVFPPERVGLASATAWMASLGGAPVGQTSLDMTAGDVADLADTLSLALGAWKENAQVTFFVPDEREAKAVARRLVSEGQGAERCGEFEATLIADIRDPDRHVLVVFGGSDDAGVLVYDRTLLVKQDEAVIYNRVFEMSASSAGLLSVLEMAYAAQQRIDIETAIVSLIDAHRYPTVDVVVTNGEGSDVDLARFELLNGLAWSAAFDPEGGEVPAHYAHPSAPGRQPKTLVPVNGLH